MKYGNAKFRFGQKVKAVFDDLTVTGKISKVFDSRKAMGNSTYVLAFDKPSDADRGQIGESRYNLTFKSYVPSYDRVETYTIELIPESLIEAV